MQTKTSLLYLLGFLGILNSGNGQSNESLLYQIDGNGIETSYIYGTFHMLPQKDFEMKDKVKEAFVESNLIVLEMDMDDPDLQSNMMKGIRMKEGMTLDKLLDENEYKVLDKELKNTVGVGLEAFNTMKPFFLAQMLLSKFLGEQPASYEGTFIQMAKEHKKEILGLEEVEDQLAIFDAISYESQAEDIMEMVEQEDEMRSIFVKMIDLYKSENITGLYDLFEEYYDDNEDEMDIMLHDRNHKWIPKINSFAKDQSVFFGVGAGHLGGDEGVIQLLKDAGYQVTPLK